LSSAAAAMLAIPPISNFDPTGSASAPYTAVQLGLCSTLNISCANVQDRGTTIDGNKVGWGATYVASFLWDEVHSPVGTHPSDAGAIDEASMIYSQAVDPLGSQCSQNCTLYGNTTLQNGDTTPPVTVANTLASGYSDVNFIGTGNKYLLGVGNISETTFGVANKFFLFDGTTGST